MVMATLLAAKPAAACQCSPASDADAVATSPLVIAGTVTRQTRGSANSADFTVDLGDVVTLKGDAVGPVLAIENGFDCAAQRLETGKRYLIYLPSKDAIMTVCGRVVEVAHATSHELSAFPALSAPAPPASEPGPTATTTGPPDATMGSAETPAENGGCASCALSASAGNDELTLVIASLANREPPAPDKTPTTIGPDFALTPPKPRTRTDQPGPACGRDVCKASERSDEPRVEPGRAARARRARARAR